MFGTSRRILEAIVTQASDLLIVAPASLLRRDQRNGEAAKNSFAESDQLVTFSKLHLN